MYLTRGQPVIYYGDEQGFIGRGRRQGRPPGHVRQPGRRATPTEHDARRHPPARTDRFDTDAPLYQHIKALVALRAAHPALADGAQVHRYASRTTPASSPSPASTRASGVEYVVALNNATTARVGDVRDLRPRPDVRAALRRRTAVRSDRPGGRLTVTVPPQSASRSGRPRSPMDKPKSAPAVYLDLARRRCRRRRPRGDRRGHPRRHLHPGHVPLPAGRHDGLDHARHRRQRPLPRLPRRHRRSGPRARCSSTAPSPRTRAATVGRLVVRRRRRPEGQRRWRRRRRSGDPARQRQRPRHHNTEMGCAGRLGARLRPGPADARPERPDLEGHLHRSRPAPTPTRRRSTRAGTRTTAPAASPDGGNISYTAPAGPGHASTTTTRTHWVTSDAQGPIITAPGLLPVRARLPGGLDAGLHAAVAAGPRRRRHLHLAQRPDPGRRLRVQGRRTV